MVYKILWVVSFPRCIAGPNIDGSCCVRFNAAIYIMAGSVLRALYLKEWHV